jgi:hypothetical protein
MNSISSDPGGNALALNVSCTGRDSAGIVQREVVRHRPVAVARPSLDGVHLLGVRRAAAVHPELVVEADGVDHQRVLLPPPDRVAPPRGNQIVGMRPAVHENVPDAAGVAVLMHDVDRPGACAISGTVSPISAIEKATALVKAPPI